MTREITVAYIQFPVTLDIRQNGDVISSLLNSCPPGALVVTPEGAISGYAPGPDFPDCIEVEALERAIASLHETAASRGQHLILGACVRRAGMWRNAAPLLSPGGKRAKYWKANLAQAERGVFQPGDEFPVFDLALSQGSAIRIGVQICREIRYPEQWRHLAACGAELIAFVNNAVGDAAIAPIWKSHLISRAAETQRYVIAANNAATDQKCPSMIIDPAGGILSETLSAAPATGVAVIDLALVSDYVIGQSRRDLALKR